jgi:hypothetical protein
MTSLLCSLSTLDGPSLLGLEKATQRESQRRASARSLIDFTCYTNFRYEPAGLHRQIAEQLERVERGEVDRLMLLVPPHHGKSELASRRFPAWYLGRHPEEHFISASASFALAEDFGRDVRNLMKSEELPKFLTCSSPRIAKRADVGIQRKAAAITRSALAALSTDAERT